MPVKKNMDQVIINEWHNYYNYIEFFCKGIREAFQKIFYEFHRGKIEFVF